MMPEQALPVSDSELQWRCRRGLLELDLFLSRFIENKTGFAALNEDEKIQFYQLIEFSDQELYEILIGKTFAVELPLNEIVRKIQSCSAL